MTTTKIIKKAKRKRIMKVRGFLISIANINDVDGLTIYDLIHFLVKHWPHIKRIYDHPNFENNLYGIISDYKNCYIYYMCFVDCKENTIRFFYFDNDRPIEIDEKILKQLKLRDCMSGRVSAN